MELDHEKLDVYRIGLDFAAWAYTLCRNLRGADRHARDQLLRASQSISLNIAEGCGKIPQAERGRFLQIASGSARECGAILDILGRCDVLDGTTLQTGKAMLIRIVAMLTRMIDRCGQIREDEGMYWTESVYVNVNEHANGTGKPS